MAKLIIDSADELEAIGATQADLDAFVARIASRTWFDLATPDPEFSGFTIEDGDHLPGRPTEGRLEIATLFDHLQLFVADEQQKSLVNGETIFDHLKANNLPVLGPNVGQLLHDNQELIPVELRGKVALVFCGKVYRHSGRSRYVWCLYWDGRRWEWDYCWIGSDPWDAHYRAVLLARKP